MFDKDPWGFCDARDEEPSWESDAVQALPKSLFCSSVRSTVLLLSTSTLYCESADRVYPYLAASLPGEFPPPAVGAAAGDPYPPDPCQINFSVGST